MNVRQALSHYRVVDTAYGPTRVPKVIHLDQTIAELVASGLSARNLQARQHRWKVQAYRCAECGHWHVGNEPFIPTQEMLT